MLIVKSRGEKLDCDKKNSYTFFLDPIKVVLSLENIVLFLNVIKRVYCVSRPTTCVASRQNQALLRTRTTKITTYTSEAVTKVNRYNIGALNPGSLALQLIE